MTTSDHPELARIHADWLASCVGFNNKDVAAWMDPFHEDAVTYNEGFMPLSAIRPMADAIIATAKSFDVENVDGRIVDDTAILFGDFRYEMEDGTVTTGAFTSTHARVGTDWKILLTHYTSR
jgi:hypothetical protein